MDHPCREREKGFILPTVLVMGFVLAIFATALIVLLTSEMRNTKNSRSKDRNSQAAEAAFQRAIAVLNDPASDYWNSLVRTPVPAGSPTPVASPTATGYGSLTAYPFKEIDGVAYSISVAAGDLVNNGGATTSWPNMGDKTFDRTIFVNIKDLKSNRVDRLVGKVHRTGKPFILGESGIYTTGCQDLGTSWSGNSYDSCVGNPADTQTSADCVGNMTASCFNNGTDVCLNQNLNPTPAAPPTPYIPSAPAPVAAPGNPDVLGSVYAPLTLGPSATSAGQSYQITDIDLNSGDTITFDCSVGPITLYVTGTISMGGHSGFAIIAPSPITPQNCCIAAASAIVVVGGGFVGFNGNTNFVGSLYAPESDVEVQGGGSGVFQGVMVAKSFAINGGGAGWFHYDRCLLRKKINTYTNPPVIINGWEPY